MSFCSSTLATTAGLLVKNMLLAVANRDTEYVFISIQSGEEGSDHEWPLETHVSTPCNAMCELQLST